MSYRFSEAAIDNKDFELEKSDKIHTCLLNNNRNDIFKAISFLQSNEKFLYIHGFIGTGKRQFVNYVCEYLAKDVIKLEYYCKESTVCDDILLYFMNSIDKYSNTKTLNFNAKITTVSTKFMNFISTIKKPVLIVLHTFDNILDDNKTNIQEMLVKCLKESNTKIIITTKALIPNILKDIDEDCNVFLKGFSKQIFDDFLKINGIEASEKQKEVFFELTRGYYFYTALSVKIIQALNISLPEFIQKIKNASSNLDTYLGEFYISLIPPSIRNFFWFLHSLRHGISLNALAVLDIYDEFSIQYLKSNMIIFQDDENIYLQDYFAQNVELIIPDNVEIKLHKYIIGIYEEQLKENLANRAILISRQALRAEIDYHSRCIQAIESDNTDGKILTKKNISTNTNLSKDRESDIRQNPSDLSLSKLVDEAKSLAAEDNFKDAIDKFKAILNLENIDSTTLLDIRINLARIYSSTRNFQNAIHYYELAEAYYKSHKELINLNYLYYEMTDLYYKMYKHQRAIETIKKVIYSIDTPQSLMVSACTLLGNIYSDQNNPAEAFSYYQKALDSLDSNVDDSTLAELYFKFALANDDKNDIRNAFEYYNKCISITKNNKYLALAYSNLGSCYYDQGNDEDALNCLLKAYELEKSHNNYDGIYYTALHIAQIYNNRHSELAYSYLKDAKQSAEFLNEAFYITEAHIALGDYYYNISDKSEEALIEYCSAKQVARNSQEEIDLKNIEKRINDMKLRMNKKTYSEIIKKYGE